MGASGSEGSATAMPSLMTLSACCIASHERPRRSDISESGIAAAAARCCSLLLAAARCCSLLLAAAASRRTLQRAVAAALRRLRHRARYPIKARTCGCNGVVLVAASSTGRAALLLSVSACAQHRLGGWGGGTAAPAESPMCCRRLAINDGTNRGRKDGDWRRWNTPSSLCGLYNPVGADR